MTSDHNRAVPATGSGRLVARWVQGRTPRAALGVACPVNGRKWAVLRVLACRRVQRKIVSTHYLSIAMIKRPRNLPAEQRRAVTVEAVIELAATRNPSEITTAAIAEHMHLSQGALFRHFPSKDAIFEAVMAWVAERLLDRVERAAAGIDSPLAALQAMFMAHVDFVAEHPGVPRMMFGELQRAGSTPAKRMVHTLVRRYGKRLGELIEQGKAAGEIDSALDSAAAATLFIGTVQGLVMQSLLAGDVEHMRIEAPAVFVIYSRGIEARHDS